MSKQPRSLTFVTGNSQKFDIGRKVFAAHDIALRQLEADIDEIQSEDAEKIVRDKATKAFEAAGGPVVVNDDSWSFPGLGGFPGPYMKSIVHWFSAEDFLRLTLPLEDRRAIIYQWIAYQDISGQKLFRLEYPGIILRELRGTSANSLHQIISMPADNGLTIAEAYNQGSDTSKREVAEGWRQFITWFTSNDFTSTRAAK